MAHLHALGRAETAGMAALRAPIQVETAPMALEARSADRADREVIPVNPEAMAQWAHLAPMGRMARAARAARLPAISGSGLQVEMASPEATPMPEAAPVEAVGKAETS